MHRLERWRPLILATTTESQLVNVMREYCGSFLPSELAALPPDCPRCVIESAEDIPGLALDFTAYELKFNGSDVLHSMLRDMALVFTAAAQHLKRFRPSPLG